MMISSSSKGKGLGSDQKNSMIKVLVVIMTAHGLLLGGDA